LLLGQTLLIERRGEHLIVRERDEIERLLKRAYHGEPPVDRLMSGLATVAAALNANDQCLARIAAVHLMIPDLPSVAARDAMIAENALIKYARDKGAGAANWNPALHLRAGTPPNPGWFAPTDGEADRSTAIRTAQNNVAGQASDVFPSNSKPGDPFPTAHAAAIAALLAVYAIARSTHLEYSGRIYQNADGTFSYTQGLTDSQRYPDIPNRNCCPSNASPGNVPEGTLDMGTYHTHPIDRHAEFSMLDKSFYTYQDKRPGYLAGTNDQGIGEILQFTPGETVYRGITQTIGTISGGRFIPNPKFNPDKKPRIPPPEGDSCDPSKPDPEKE
jgi:hypothetical protein